MHETVKTPFNQIAFVKRPRIINALRVLCAISKFSKYDSNQQNPMTNSKICIGAAVIKARPSLQKYAMLE